MKQYELLCIDMFQTLVNVNTRTPFIWKRILKDKYNDQLKDRCARLVSLKVINKFHEFVNSGQEFINLKSMFEPFFYDIKNDINIDFNPKLAVQIFINEHGKSALYNDTSEFFNLIDNKIPICLVSDADEEMITPLLEKFKFDNVFISEKIKSYKNDPESKIFKQVINHYGKNPEKIIHIGDASSDIIGANKVGIKTCWINRNGLQRKYNVQPDYIINSLTEVIKILNI